jgi:hypothetical protein
LVRTVRKRGGTIPNEISFNMPLLKEMRFIAMLCRGDVGKRASFDFNSIL